MQKTIFHLAYVLFVAAITFGYSTSQAEALHTLETAHYRIAFPKKYEQMGGEILEIAEKVWPTLAKAYDSYEHYETIDILITDDGDDANGFAIYNFSRVAIFAPHMDWVMRNRHTWLRNVVTHELAHIFTLRRAAWLSPVDQVDIYGGTYNYSDRINYSFHLPWIPLVAPTWYIEGIAQFEAAQNGNDSWDSQRDMVLRDAYLTGTLPTLDFIETFQSDEDWTQSERCYNTGFGFLLYLKNRFGVDKVRELAKPKPIFNFSYSVRKAFGKELPDLFEDFRRSLVERYADFKDFSVDSLADSEMKGGYQQNLALSSDGRFMAWLGNGENRRAPLNWIFWKEIGSGKINKSASTVDKPQGLTAPVNTGLNQTQQYHLKAAPTLASGLNGDYGSMSVFSGQRMGNPLLGLARNIIPNIQRRAISRTNSPTKAVLPSDVERSDEAGSSGLEFNHDNSKLLTTRRDKYAAYTDIWEYDFRSKEDEEDKWHRLTWEIRAAYPSYHPTKNLIVYTSKSYGTSNLRLLDSTGQGFILTNFTDGEQIYNPRFNGKGDSIYFTLGIEDKEAIVSINAGTPAFDPFLALRDSAVFPDSSYLAKSQRLTFITPMKHGSIRNIRFSNDTLFWSSNSEDSLNSVYDIYAKLPQDSAVYRATQVAGQALEALPHNGTLYYQGYHRQKFQIFKQTLALTRTKNILYSVTDSLPTFKPKPLEYSKAFDTSTYYGTKVATEIIPYLAVQPQFLSGDRSFTDLALGVNVTMGEAYGGWMQSVGGAITKRANLKDPMNYQLSYSGFLTSTSIRHTTFDWSPALYYGLFHDVLQFNDRRDVNDGFVIGSDSISVKGNQSARSQFSRYAASVASPLPYGLLIDASFWTQSITEIDNQAIVFHNFTTNENFTQKQEATSLSDALQHRHFNTGLNWSWSKGMWGTYLPTGGWISTGIHKWWATYETGAFTTLDSATSNQLIMEGNIAPRGILPLAKFEPWNFDIAGGGLFSLGKTFTLFANVEASAFLNKEPMSTDSVQVTPNNFTTVENLDDGLWVMANRIGYFRLHGYPYNFKYRGRQIMEGSSMVYGQFGIQIPIKVGLFIPDLPTSSLKQFLISGIGEWGTTLNSAPDKIYRSLEEGQHHLLLDFGLKASMNFNLYHQIPFTLYAQAFVPFNELKAENLYWDDFSHTGRPNPDGSASPEQIRNAGQDRATYINQVKDPRYFVGFNLGIF